MTDIYRRDLLTGTAAIAGLASIGSVARADVAAGRDPFNYEITRTEEEWRAMLGDDYQILRGGGTEELRSSPNWAESREGTYACRGCDLLQYDSFNKVAIPKGWAFFTASEPNSQLMSQDGPTDMSSRRSAFDIRIEVHCRRCGSHMGHILLVEGRVLHCINGASLVFTEAAA